MSSLFKVLGGFFNKNRKRDYQFLLLLIGISTSIRLIFLPELGWEIQLLAFGMSSIIIPTGYESLTWLNRKLNKSLPFESNPALRITVQILLSLIITGCLVYIVYTAARSKLPVEFNKYGFFLLSIFYVSTTLFFNALYFARYFLDKWKKAILNQEQLEKEKTQVQYQNLINQLNPHFFFNSLTSLSGLIYKDQQLASQFLQQLSKVYRYMLENKDKELVSLETEMNFASQYINLLKTRFGKGIEVNIDIKEEALSCMIVPVTIQILVENAVKHNVIDAEGPLVINIFTGNGMLHVANNIQPKFNIEGSNKQGLENFKAMYSYLSKIPVLVMKDDKSFTVQIPLL